MHCWQRPVLNRKAVPVKVNILLREKHNWQKEQGKKVEFFHRLGFSWIINAELPEILHLLTP